MRRWGLIFVLAAAGCTRDSGKADALFTLDRVHDLHLEIAPSELAEMEGRVVAKVPVVATLTIGKDVYQNVAVRYAGEYAVRRCANMKNLCSKMSLKLDFDRFVPGRRVYGLAALNLRSGFNDPSLAREVLAYRVFARMGFAASRTGFAKLTINGEVKGIYGLVEPVDRHFLAARGLKPPLFREVWPRSDSPGPYLRASRTKPRTYEPLLGLQSKLTKGEDVSTDVDLVGLARFFAISAGIGSWDGPLKFSCDTERDCENANFFWSRDKRGRLALVPWDLEHTFEPYAIDLFSGLAQRPSQCEPAPRCFVWNVGNCPAAWSRKRLLPVRCDPLVDLTMRTQRADYLKASKELVAQLAKAKSEAKAIRKLLEAQGTPDVTKVTFGRSHEVLMKTIDERMAKVTEEPPGG